jgi:hypothetical protein
VHLRDGLERPDLIKLADTLAAVIADEGDGIPEAIPRAASR